MKRTLGLAAAIILIAASFVHAAPKDATLTIGFKFETPTMDPHTESSQVSNMRNRWVFQTIMHRTPEGKLIPLLAESHKWVDAKTLEITLKPGLKFSNGEDVDAKAVQYSMRRVFDKKLKSRQTRRMRVIKGDNAVQIVSKYVVRFNLAFPDVGFLNRLGNVGVIVPPKYYSENHHRLGYLATHPIGSGPYVLKEWVRDDHAIYEANPTFWDPQYPKVKRVVAKIIPDATARVAALIKGEVDVIFTVPQPMWGRINQSGKARVISKPSIRIFRIGMYQKWGGILGNQKVRQAIAHAVDRKALRSVLAGSADEATTALHPWTEGYVSPEEFPYPYEYNPAKAKQLLAEAGYPKGIDIDLIANTGAYLKSKEVAEVLTGMLNKSGIRAKLVSLSNRGFRNAFRKNRNKPSKDFKPFLFFQSFGGGGGDSDLQLGALFGCKGAWSGWCDKDGYAQKMIKKASSSTDYKERHEIFAEISKRMTNVVAVIPLYRLHATFGLGNKVDWDPRVD
ncbi:MAG: ABC transporter substrate-binding protein, partial [bacterium]|nr:ABC transporter substrate-binding protein [bacterium]